MRSIFHTEGISFVPQGTNFIEKEKASRNYVKVGPDGTTYYLEQATQKYHNEKLLVNKQMIKTGIDDIPNIKGLKDAINKK